jgi:hypothetical protein
MADETETPYEPLSEDDIAQDKAMRAALAGQTVAQMNTLADRAAAPIMPPRNRTYFGPNIAGGGPSPQQFFQDAPTNLMLNRMPVPPIDQTGQVASRIQAATAPESDPAMLGRLRGLDRPGTRTLGISRPPLPTQGVGEMQFEAQQGYLRDVATMGQGEAFKKWAPLLFGQGNRGSAWGMTPAQRAANAIATQRVAIAQQESNRRQQALTAPSNKLSQTGLIDYRNNAARMAQIQKELDVLETKGENLLPEERAKRDNLAKEYLSRMPEGVKADQKPTATGTTPIRPNVAKPKASTARIRVRNPQGKIGSIPADQLDDALAAGWKRM